MLRMDGEERGESDDEEVNIVRGSAAEILCLKLGLGEVDQRPPSLSIGADRGSHSTFEPPPRNVRLVSPSRMPKTDGDVFV